MHTLSTLEFVTRLAVGLGCGALIGCAASRYGTRVVVMPAAGGGCAPGRVSPLGGRARW